MECIYPVGCCLADSKAYRCEAGLDSRRRFVVFDVALTRPVLNPVLLASNSPVSVELYCCMLLPKKVMVKMSFG